MALRLEVEAAAEPFYPTAGVYEALLTGEEGVTLTAHLDFQLLLGGAGKEGVAAGAGDASVMEELWMDLCLHVMPFRKGA